MKEINGDDTIANQYSKIWNNFHEIKEQTYREIGMSKNKIKSKFK